MHKIIYTKSFLKDLINIKEFISKDNEFYALKTIENINNTIDILKDFPMLWKVFENERRIIIEKDYKYKIFYKIKVKDIYILRVYKYK